MKTFREYITEGAEKVTRDGQVYTYKIIKTSKGNNHESPYWSIMMKPVKNKELNILLYRDMFWYTTGYDQNSNSGEQFYLNTSGWGSAGNGGGVTSKSTPYLTGNTKEYVEEILSNNSSYQKEADEKLEYFPNNSKMSDFK